MAAEVVAAVLVEALEGAAMAVAELEAAAREEEVMAAVMVGAGRRVLSASTVSQSLD